MVRQWQWFRRCLLVVLTTFAGFAAAQVAGPALVTVGGPTLHKVDVLPGQTAAEVTVPVSAATRLQLQIIAPVPSPQFSVLTPAGAVMSLANATYMDGAAFAPAIPGGTLHTPWMAQPANGNWKVRVTFAPAAVRTVVLVTALAESPYRASVLLGGVNFRQGDATAASLFLLANEAPVTGAAVTLTALTPSGSTVNLSPNDSATPSTADAKANDGLYTGAIVFSEVGRYILSGRAQFTTANGAVTREALAVAFVSPPKLDLNGISTGVQSGPNNCISAVTVNLSTFLHTAGQVVAKAVLRGSNGRKMQRTLSVSATAGTLPLNLLFPAADVRNELGVSGPYTVELVQVVVTAANGTTLEGSANDATVTSAVALPSLCINPVSVGSSATVTPVVTNGYISSLNVSFPVSVAAGGVYRISFRVTGSERQQVIASSQSPQLIAGLNTVSITVPAGNLQMADGPFQVESVLVLGPSGSATVSFVGNATPFSRWQFTPTFKGDLNGDGRVDQVDRDLLATFRNMRALSPGDRRDLDRSGLVDLRDVQLLQRLYCASGTCTP